MNSVKTFQEFFDACVGAWSTERTYHYLMRQEVERSHTDFVIHPVSKDIKIKVLNDNNYSVSSDLDQFPGFHLEFKTVSEKGEEVNQQLNFLFVYRSPHSSSAGQSHSNLDSTSFTLEGDYLRDRAYEEAKPIVSHFRFNPVTRELLMTTTYTRTVSVDSITLINPQLRIRRILNYQRPEPGEPLRNLALAGFGVEQKSH